MIPSAITTFLNWIKRWLWYKPIAPPEPLKAVEVESQYVVIKYNGQRINLKKTEVRMFHAMDRKNKRAMVRKFATMERKGLIRFEEINGKTIAIKNKDYESKDDVR
jgi:hypothetical protein